MEPTTETTATPASKKVNPAHAAKAIREFKTLEEAQAYAQGDDRMPVVEALRIKAEMAAPPTAPDLGAVAPAKSEPKPRKAGTPLVATLNNLQSSILKLGAQGIPAPRDFDERESSRTNVPAWLPKASNDGQELVYAKLEKAALLEHPWISGPDAWMVPVTRDTFTDIEEANFNVEGNVQDGDLIICVGLAINAKKRHMIKSKRATQRVQVLEPQARKIKTKSPEGRGEIEGAVTSGLGGYNAGIDSILGPMPHN